MLSALATGYLQAQPVIQSTNYYPAGTTLQFELANISNIQPGSSGPAQTWNFSTLNLTGDTYTHHYLPAVSTPFATQFPSSNIGIEVIDNTNADTAYMYQTKNNAQVTYDGNAQNDGGNSVAFVNSNPQTIFDFPVSFGSTATDSLSGSMIISGGGMSMEIYRFGTQSMIADGYGTLQLPGAAFSNCLRLKYRQVLTDSTLFTGMPFPPTIGTDIKTMYTWVQIVNGMAIERLTMTYDTITDDNGTQYETYCQLNRGNTTGIFKPQTEAGLISIYPNPARERFTLKPLRPVQGTITLTIIDGQGTEIWKETTGGESIAAGHTVSVEQLPAGIYIVRMTTEEGSFTQRLIRD